jgi:hypothetical protein
MKHVGTLNVKSTLPERRAPQGRNLTAAMRDINLAVFLPEDVGENEHAQKTVLDHG